MCTRLYSYLNNHHILYDYQFGFRKGHSTTLALRDVLDQIYNQLDSNRKVLGIFLDLQKAFDTVDHQILLAKLYNYGIRGIIYMVGQKMKQLWFVLLLQPFKIK